MSSLTADRLYRLLPAVYRIRDAEQPGEPLRALIGLLAQQFEALEDNIEQLYDDQFIETCANWVAPYIGDLVGYRPLHPNTGGGSPGGAAADASAAAGVVVRSPRAEVANTIAYRRRKGTAAMLEQLARDVTGWSARAVEFFEQLATSQYMKHVRPAALATADLRSTTNLRQLGGAFNRVAHTAEMRRPEAGSGRYNIPNVGIFLWRLQPFSLTEVPLTPHDAADPANRRFRFDPLGADRPLFRRPLTERQITHIAEPLNVPAPIDARLMAREVHAAQADPALHGSDYGDSDGPAGPRRASVLLARADAADPAAPALPLAIGDICVCDLRDVDNGGGSIDWAGEATLAAGKVAIDPRLGRVLLGSGVDNAVPLLATFHHGFSRPIGGGEYARDVADVADPALPQRQARLGEPLQPQLDAVRAGGRLLLQDSRRYAQTPVFRVDAVTAVGQPGIEVVVAARDGARPLIGSAGPLALDIGARGRLVLDGLLIAGGALQLAAAADDEPRELVLRHCTLVPGLALHADGSAQSAGAASLIVAHPFTTVTLDHCISGALQVQRDAALTVIDSVVDAGSPSAVAYTGTMAGEPGAALTVRDSTVVGKVRTQTMTLASNTLFVAERAAADSWPAPLWVERRQQGCVRFCFVPAGSLVPRRFHCVSNAADTDDARPPFAVPQFTSLRYGDPGYAQLRRASGLALLQGADDEGEIGVMHALFQPQREADLRIRLDEYLRFGLHAGLFYVT